MLTINITKGFTKNLIKHQYEKPIEYNILIVYFIKILKDFGMKKFKNGYDDESQIFEYDYDEYFIFDSKYRLIERSKYKKLIKNVIYNICIEGNETPPIPSETYYSPAHKLFPKDPRKTIVKLNDDDDYCVITNCNKNCNEYVYKLVVYLPPTTSFFCETFLNQMNFRIPSGLYMYQHIMTSDKLIIDITKGFSKNLISYKYKKPINNNTLISYLFKIYKFEKMMNGFDFDKSQFLENNKNEYIIRDLKNRIIEKGSCNINIKTIIPLISIVCMNITLFGYSSVDEKFEIIKSTRNPNFKFILMSDIFEKYDYLSYSEIHLYNKINFQRNYIPINTTSTIVKNKSKASSSNIGKNSLKKQPKAKFNNNKFRIIKDETGVDNVSVIDNLKTYFWS